MPTEKQKFLKEWHRDHSGDASLVKRGKIAWNRMQADTKVLQRKAQKEMELAAQQQDLST